MDQARLHCWKRAGLITRMAGLLPERLFALLFVVEFL